MSLHVSLHRHCKVARPRKIGRDENTSVAWRINREGTTQRWCRCRETDLLRKRTCVIRPRAIRDANQQPTPMDGSRCNAAAATRKIGLIIENAGYLARNSHLENTIIRTRQEEMGIACLLFFLLHAPCSESEWSTRSIRLTHGFGTYTCRVRHVEFRTACRIRFTNPVSARGKESPLKFSIHWTAIHADTGDFFPSHDTPILFAIGTYWVTALRFSSVPRSCPPLRTGSRDSENTKGGSRRSTRYRPKKKSRAILGGSFLPSFSKVRGIRHFLAFSVHGHYRRSMQALHYRCRFARQAYISDARGAINVSMILVASFPWIPDQKPRNAFSFRCYLKIISGDKY